MSLIISALLMLVFMAVGMPIAFAIVLGVIVVMAHAGQVLVTVPLSMFNSTDSTILVAVPLFIFAGTVMESGGIARRLIDFAASLVGFFRGGLAMTNILANMFFAEMSGAGVADAVALGKVFIPQMEKNGYSRKFAAALTASAAGIGIIIPPSIPMIVYGGATGTSISELFIAGIVPGLIMGLAFMVVTYVLARRYDFPVATSFRLSYVWSTFKRGSLSLLIPFVILGGVLSGFFTPTEAAAVGVVISLFIGSFVYREIDIRKLHSMLVESAKQTSAVMMLVAASGALGWVFADAGVSGIVFNLITGVSTNPIIILLVSAFILLVLGMLLQSTPIIILVAPILMPVVHSAGISPVQFGIMMVVMLAIGQQTPPVCTVLSAVAALSKLPMLDVFAASKYYLLAMFVVVLLIILFPSISLSLPSVIG